MSLEESINLLITEIKKISVLIQKNNELLLTRNEEPPVKKRRTLNEVDAAEYIGMSRSFLAQDRMNGHRYSRKKGPNPIKIGRTVRYDIDELNA